MNRRPLELAHLRNGPPAHRLAIRDADSDGRGAFPWLPTGPRVEILLDSNPASALARGVKQDQQDWHFLPDPQVVVPNVEVNHVVFAGPSVSMALS